MAGEAYRSARTLGITRTNVGRRRLLDHGKSGAPGNFAAVPILALTEISNKTLRGCVSLRGA
jgi:hypothetical protein